MKKILSLSIVLFFLTGTISAQIISVVSPTNEIKIYTDLPTAVSEATAGSMIYLPGGTVTGNIEISKKLHIVGVGYRSDVNPVAGASRIDGDITFVEGADGSALIGVYLHGYLYIGKQGATSYKVNNLIIKQCNLSYVELRVPNNQTYGGTGIMLDQNIFRSTYVVMRTKKAIITNNIFKNENNININYLAESQIKNNIFFGTNPIFVNGDANQEMNYTNIIENNVFVKGLPATWSTLNVLSLQGNIICNSTARTGNISDVDANNLFEGGVTGEDFRLKEASGGKGNGTDSKDIGIYGGSGWIEGGIPFTPHIESSNIATQTNTDGTLPVRIKVTVNE